MDDDEVKLKMQDIARSVKAQVPGRAFFVMIWPAETDQKAHYVGNCERSQAVAGMVDFIKRNGGPNLEVGNRN